MLMMALLHVHHDGYFQKVPYLVYGLGETKKVERDADYLSIGNIKGIVIELGYNARRIKKIYFRKPELPFEESLVSIERDEDVRELVRLCKSIEYVNLYVEHNDEVDFVESNESNDDHSDCMVDYEYDEYGSDVEDEEIARIREKKKKMHKEVLADLEGLRAENGEDWEQSNALDDIYAHYQDSDDADSPITSDTDDDDGDDKQRKKKKKRTIRYPRYNASSSKEGIELQVGLMFINKEQLRDAVEDYRIMKGTEMLRRTYAYTLQPINGPNLWSPCEEEPIPSLYHSSNAIVSPLIDLASAPPVSAYVASGSVASGSAASASAHTACVTSTASFFVDTAPEIVATSSAHVFDAPDFLSTINFLDAATEHPGAIEFGTTTAAHDTADIFINYIPKGKLPVRRNRDGEVIPTHNSLTFATLDE
ncbi:hypothetical protein Cgig2_017218 [Carnegiea gigantea]|uniref:PB1-like domain-containing protein n=1 Tax=Carnegiea gigantea TaxID=171969 RepID=A0A9Q1KGQ5_9CARY|nr:hypothetical protein Cgig2_017218 [Carnegiea gigantea]